MRYKKYWKKKQRENWQQNEKNDLPMINILGITFVVILLIVLSTDFGWKTFTSLIENIVFKSSHK